MKKYYECDCTDSDHVISVETDHDADWEECVISTQLAPLHPWYKRIWVALKYIVNPHGDYSHWHDTNLSYAKTQELRDQLDAFLEAHKDAEAQAEAAFASLRAAAQAGMSTELKENQS
jgi:hypothetical protein